MDPRDKHIEIPFDGKLMTAEPSTIGKNFQTLKNMRYTDTHIKGISGFAKVTTAVIDSANKIVKSAFHFFKSQPFESHILVQAYNTPLTGAGVYDCITTPPTSAAFSSAVVVTQSTGFGLGRFSNAPDGQMIFCNGVDACIWGGVESKIGSAFADTAAMTAALSSPVAPKDVTDKLQNTKTDSANVLTYDSSYKVLLIGTPRPARAAYFHVSSANTSANTLEFYYSTTGAWTKTTVNYDMTRVSGKSFAQSGRIEWGTTVGVCKPRYFLGYYLYWYQFIIDAGSANISHITVDMPMQGIIDLWDGVYRECVKFYKYITGTEYTEHTTAVLYEDYDSTSAETYYGISDLVAATTTLEAYFTEKMSGLYFNLPDAYVNGNASVVSINYWNGSAFATVGSVSDGTSIGGATFGRSGVISWANANIGLEIKRSNNDTPLYCYQIAFSGNLDASVRLDYVAGITASKDISYYKFPVFAQGRVLLCADMAGDKYKAIASSKFMPQVYQGADAADLYFGDEGELTCGTELFSQYGSSLYSLILMFKDTETWVVAGQDITQWENNTFLLSSSIGCPAPMTLKTINLRAEPGAGVNRALAIWQGANGIYMSDGRAPIPIHGDIEAYFDPLDSRCIKYSMIGDSVGTIDHVNQSYMWKFASGTSATALNKELHYDIKRNKWYEVERSSALQNALAVKDADGNFYTYGFASDAHMLRLEYGSTFDGTAITQTHQQGDIPLAGLGKEFRVSSIKLILKAQSATTDDITCTYYADGSTTGTDLPAMTSAKSGYRIAQPLKQLKIDGYPYLSLKYVTTTYGHEPIAQVIANHPTHDD